MADAEKPVRQMQSSVESEENHNHEENKVIPEVCIELLSVKIIQIQPIKWLIITDMEKGYLADYKK